MAASLHRDRAASLLVLTDMPDRAEAERTLFEPEYLGIAPRRDRVFVDFHMYLAAPGEI